MTIRDIGHRHNTYRVYRGNTASGEPVVITYVTPSAQDRQEPRSGVVRLAASTGLPHTAR